MRIIINNIYFVVREIFRPAAWLTTLELDKSAKFTFENGIDVDLALL
jgi:hypothetical protein